MQPYHWALLTALTWGCVPILEKTGLGKMDVWPGLFYRCIGVLIGAIMLLAFQFTQIKEAFTARPFSWLYLVAGGFLASLVGQLFFYFSLKTGEASKVVPIAAIYPLVSFILGVLLLSEKVTPAKIGGLVCILGGVFLLK